MSAVVRAARCRARPFLPSARVTTGAGGQRLAPPTRAGGPRSHAPNSSPGEQGSHPNSPLPTLRPGTIDIPVVTGSQTTSQEYFARRTASEGRLPILLGPQSVQRRPSGPYCAGRFIHRTQRTNRLCPEEHETRRASRRSTGPRCFRGVGGGSVACREPGPPPPSYRSRDDAPGRPGRRPDASSPSETAPGPDPAGPSDEIVVFRTQSSRGPAESREIRAGTPVAPRTRVY
jgi:hypothetical protein